MTQPPRTPAQQIVSVNIDEDLKARLAELAAENDRSVSAEIRVAIRAHLDGKAKVGTSE